MAVKSSTENMEEEILVWARKYVQEHGRELNPDEKQLRCLARNKKKYGERYCPCRLRSDDTEKHCPIISPCIYHYDEVTKEGHCHCNLFFKKQETEARSE